MAHRAWHTLKSSTIFWCEIFLPARLHNNAGWGLARWPFQLARMRGIQKPAGDALHEVLLYSSGVIFHDYLNKLEWMMCNWSGWVGFKHQPMTHCMRWKISCENRQCDMFHEFIFFWSERELLNVLVSVFKNTSILFRPFQLRYGKEKPAVLLHHQGISELGIL